MVLVPMILIAILQLEFATMENVYAIIIGEQTIVATLNHNMVETLLVPIIILNHSSMVLPLQWNKLDLIVDVEPILLG